MVSPVRLVLDHLEYFLHTDVHLLTMLWRVVLQHCRELSAKEGGQVVQVPRCLASSVLVCFSLACRFPLLPGRSARCCVLFQILVMSR